MFSKAIERVCIARSRNGGCVIQSAVSQYSSISIGLSKFDATRVKFHYDDWLSVTATSDKLVISRDINFVAGEPQSTSQGCEELAQSHKFRTVSDSTPFLVRDVVAILYYVSVSLHARGKR